MGSACGGRAFDSFLSVKALAPAQSPDGCRCAVDGTLLCPAKPARTPPAPFVHRFSGRRELTQAVSWWCQIGWHTWSRWETQRRSFMHLSFQQRRCARCDRLETRVA